MTDTHQNFNIFATVKPAAGELPNELARTMAPHPLIHQELPYHPEYFVYNRRLAAGRMNNYTPDEVYWQVRTNVIMRHTAELPVVVKGADAETLLNRVFPREVSRNKVGRCSYQFACDHAGGMLTDGVLVRVARDEFWFGQGDGDVISFMKAHARGLEVDIGDPGIWVTQVQGPNALQVLEAAIEGPMPAPFNYFDMARVPIAGEEVVITRTGFTGELGWEYYLEPHQDVQAVGRTILDAGAAFGMMPTSAEAFRARRIEAGLLNAGSDFDETTTPFDAGLGHLVDFKKEDFSGRDALLEVGRSCRTWGMRVRGGIARIGRTLFRDRTSCGRVCSSAFSPFLDCGVAIIRLDTAGLQPGDPLEVDGLNGTRCTAEVCALPMYDPQGAIVRGRAIEIPRRPAA
ncbi:MAG: aminomethyl transferase family protein [Gammaproteobacteria bacterium]|nr:aminomethyl transferase family protein [Gammaproteobacteria bacterium]